jgi:uncharacterized protein with ATP-grasp and redox domains
MLRVFRPKPGPGASADQRQGIRLRTYLDCYPCFLRQALSAARRAGGDNRRQLSVVRHSLALLEALEPGATPPEIAHRLHSIVREEIGASDPYGLAKEESTRQAIGLYPALKDRVRLSSDPLGCALRLSIAGNIIDLGAADDYENLERVIERVLSQPLAVDHRPNLFTAIERADHILFLADNAGETVFDRIFIEALTVPVVYAVKKNPIINDATVKDAHEAGLDRVATVIDNGTDAPGTVMALCSKEFMDAFTSAPVVIAKGQAHYETLSEADPKVFCLLQIKCPVIARDIGAPVGGIAVIQSQGRQTAGGKETPP